MTPSSGMKESEKERGTIRLATIPSPPTGRSKWNFPPTTLTLSSAVPLLV